MMPKWRLVKFISTYKFVNYSDILEISRNLFLLISIFYGKKRKIRCPLCGFLETIKKGKLDGSSSYFCKNCNSYFTDRRVHISKQNMFVWFEKWVRDKQSISQISAVSGYSERTLKRYFYKVLPTCPTWQIQKREKVNLLIDETYFTNKVCLLLYRDNNIKMTILYRLTNQEALRDLTEDLLAIKSVGI